MNDILEVENISKQYRLGLVGTGTLSHDLNRLWHSLRGKNDPYLMIGSDNDRSTKAHGDYVWALRNINFRVERGEVLGIIGKNGAGKSTLLKILSRVTSPTTGVIRTAGRIASLLEVGTGFHPELTGRENIYLNGAILGMTKAEIKSKEDEIISFSGCEMYIDTPVKRYSSGMRVRLAFAVAAHLEPDILVIDEVLAVGDAEFQKKAIGKMKDISEGEGRTVLFVSHNMASVENLCSKCILLENGQIKKKDFTKNVIAEYLQLNVNRTSFVRDKMNISSKAFFKDLYILNNGIKTNKIQCGDNFQLITLVESNEILLDLKIEVGIDNDKGDRLLYLCNDLVASKISLNKGENMIKISINKFPLKPSIYSITCRLSDKANNQIDRVANNFNIAVEEGDFFGTGRFNLKTGTHFIVDHSFAIVE